VITLAIVPAPWIDLLVVGLIGFVFLSSIEIVKLITRVDDSKKKLSDLEAEFKTTQEEKDKAITGIKERYEGQIKELKETISKLEKEKAARMSDAMNGPLNLAKCPI
jgi:predicted transcriptional regulator